MVWVPMACREHLHSQTSLSSCTVAFPEILSPAMTPESYTVPAAATWLSPGSSHSSQYPASGLFGPAQKMVTMLWFD